jgi:hypothetical protein
MNQLKTVFTSLSQSDNISVQYITPLQAVRTVEINENTAVSYLISSYSVVIQLNFVNTYCNTENLHCKKSHSLFRNLFPIIWKIFQKLEAKVCQEKKLFNLGLIYRCTKQRQYIFLISLPLNPELKVIVEFQNSYMFAITGIGNK